MRGKAPLGTRVLRDARDWEALTDDQVIATREKANRTGSSRAARIVTGLPDRRARIKEATIDLPGRRLMLRVHRPKNPDRKLPLIVSFHGGGFIAGTAAQNDWLNSYLAARCPAVVISVEYRLAPQHPLPQPVEDGYDTLVRLVEDAVGWGIDPAAVAVMGESAGGTIAALAALRARKDGPPLRAQVLNYPSTDWTETMADYPSIAENADNPTLPLSRLRTARKLSVPSTLDPRSVSPVKFEHLAGLPPTLVVTAALDPVADHGRRYVERLREDGTDARLTCYPKATHSFLSTPGLVPAARPARREILAFLRGLLHPALRSTGASTRPATSTHPPSQPDQRVPEMEPHPATTHHNTFELIISNLALHNIPSAAGRRAAIDEAVRVLRPGRRLAIADLWATKRNRARSSGDRLGVGPTGLWRRACTPG